MVKIKILWVRISLALYLSQLLFKIYSKHAKNSTLQKVYITEKIGTWSKNVSAAYMLYHTNSSFIVTISLGKEVKFTVVFSNYTKGKSYIRNYVTKWTVGQNRNS